MKSARHEKIIELIQEYDIDTHPENTDPNKDYGGNQNFHLEYEFSTYRLVIMDFLNDIGKSACK